MWSDQDSVTPASSAMLFAVHVDGATDGTWSAPETAIGGTNMADDHINLKADASGPRLRCHQDRSERDADRPAPGAEDRWDVGQAPIR